MARPDRNEHTYGSAFVALGLAGRLDMVVGEWQALARARVDIGPVGASALIKVGVGRRARDRERAARGHGMSGVLCWWWWGAWMGSSS
jgi:hypothetical protein